MKLFLRISLCLVDFKVQIKRHFKSIKFLYCDIFPIHDRHRGHNVDLNMEKCHNKQSSMCQGQRDKDLHMLHTV